MGTESTWGQLRYMLNDVDNQGSGRIDAWRFDWESNLTSFGVQSSLFARSAATLEAAITQVKQLTGASSVNLLAHSYGGILARAYLQGAAVDGSLPVPFQNDVTNVMTLGTPHRGIGGDYADFLADACALEPPLIQPDTCYETNTGAPQSPGEGSFLTQLNTLPIPTSLSQFTIMRGRTLGEDDLGDLVLNSDDGFMTIKGADFCGADSAISCGSGVITQQDIAASVSDNVGLCHSNSILLSCASGLNVPMAEIDDKTHPLWQTICTFLGGDSTKCKPQLNVTISPAAPPGGTVTSTSDSSINCGTTCAAWYDVGTSVTLTATEPSPGYTFSGWSVDGDFTPGPGPLTVVMNQDEAVTAVFDQETTYSYQANANTNVTMTSPSVCPINGSFTTAAPLPPYFGGDVSPLTFTFNDCFDWITNDNELYGGYFAFVIMAATDAMGSIVQWAISLADGVDVAVTPTNGDPFTATVHNIQSCNAWLLDACPLPLDPSVVSFESTLYWDYVPAQSGSSGNTNQPGTWTVSPASHVHLTRDKRRTF
jgi:hypothetical protein